MSTIRKELRQLLKDNVPLLNGNIWEASTDTEIILPHASIVESTEVDTSLEDYAGSQYVYDIWISVEPETYQSLDKIVKEIKDNISNKVFLVNMIPHYIVYEGSNEDMYVEDIKAYSKSINIRIYSLDWIIESVQEPSPITTMLDYSNKSFSNIQLDPYNWNPKDGSPALYWRQGDIKVHQSMNWGAWMDVTIHGHIIGTDKVEVKKFTDTIVRQLGKDNRAYMRDKSPMNFYEISSDIGYNPFTQGQITINARFGILKDRPIKHIYNIYINDSDKIIDSVHLRI